MSWEKFYRRRPSNLLVTKIYSTVGFNIFVYLNIEKLLILKISVRTNISSSCFKMSSFVSLILFRTRGLSFHKTVDTLKDIIVSRFNVKTTTAKRVVNVSWNWCLNSWSEGWLKIRHSLVSNLMPFRLWQ